MIISKRLLIGAITRALDRGDTYLFIYISNLNEIRSAEYALVSIGCNPGESPIPSMHVTPHGTEKPIVSVGVSLLPIRQGKNKYDMSNYRIAYSGGGMRNKYYRNLSDFKEIRANMCSGRDSL